MKSYSERDVLIWLNSLGIRGRVVERLMHVFPDIREVLEVKDSRLQYIKGIQSKTLNKIINNRNKRYIEGLFNKLEIHQSKIITILDKEYPESLNNIYERPYVLHGKGNMTQEDRLAIGIVGARKSTSYGKWACEKFTKELVDLGVTIVSGLALGIDTIAHKTAIENNGRTIAVLGNGIDRVYPKRNKKLYEEIPKNGMILTEFSHGTVPLPYNFPQRNRIISGLSLGIIVIEAKEKSGSLITAHHALEQGKDVFAVPGNINSIYSKGTNLLIKDGARPLLSMEDMMEEIRELQLSLSEKKKKSIDCSQFSKIEMSIIDTLEEGPLHCDLISYKSGLDITNVISTLTVLELKGVVKEISGRIFTLN